MTPEEESATRKRYAEILTRVPDPFGAALELYPENTKAAAWIAKNWPRHPEVLAEIETIRENEDLPTKADLQRAIWDRMNGPCMPDDFAKLGKLFAEISNFIEKPGPGVVVQNFIPKVIEIPNYGTTENWEEKVQKQQAALLNVSRSKS